MEEPITNNDKHKPGWRLVFEDDFDGEYLDLTKWNYLNGPRRDGYWSSSEVFLDGNGHLIIQVSERDGRYYSGAINTRNKFEQAYGYYEIRCQLPKEEGFWTAFWLMTDGAHLVGNEGRDGTEIDIYESPYPHEDRIQHALHWDGYGPEHKSAGHAPYIKDIYTGFHTFALEWNEDEYIFYVDGRETWRTAAGGVSQVPAFVKITAEVGTWAGDIRKANLPAQLIVDYVRVYDRIREVTIESPVAGSTVLADAPVRLSVQPDVKVAHLKILQNDVVIYEGKEVPKDLRLSAPLKEDDEEHRLMVLVTDQSGQVFTQVADFKVRRTHIHLPATGTLYVQGLLEVPGQVGLAPQEELENCTLLLHPVRAFEESEPIVLYSAETWPGSFSLDTLAFADGAYDLILQARTTLGNLSEAVRRLVIRNWERLEENFEPPGKWFGGTFDRLKTVERSAGWEFPTDQGDIFFGDTTRIASSGVEGEFLLWEHPRLRSFRLVVYARDEAVVADMELAVCADGDRWQMLEPKVESKEQGDQGWSKISLMGEIDPAYEHNYFRLGLPAAIDKERLQIGYLELWGVASGATEN